MISTDFKKWYAKVRYYNGDVEDISVRKIKTQEGNQFSPKPVFFKNYKDFNSNILYSVKTAMNDVEGKEQRYYAYIGKLAGKTYNVILETNYLYKKFNGRCSITFINSYINSILCSYFIGSIEGLNDNDKRINWPT